MHDQHELSRSWNRWVRMSMAGFAALILLSVIAPATAPDVDADKLEAEIHAEINEQRVAEGLPPIDHSETISDYASEYSQRMAQNDFFAHEPPSGPPKKQALCSPSGENLQIYPDTKGNESEIAEEIVSEWMESDGHRKNILYPQWHSEGIGVHVDGKIIVTQRFCG